MIEESNPVPQRESGHESVAPFYDLHAPQNIPEMVDFFQFAAKKHARREIQDVLELGVGTGRFALPLALAGYQLTGTDGSARMLQHCREKAERDQLEIVLREEWFQDLNDLEAFDSVVAIFTALGFLENHQAIRNCLQACLRATRAGGFVLIDVPNSHQGLIDPWAGCRPVTYVDGERKLERFLQMIPRTLEGKVLYRDRGIVTEADGSKRVYEEEFSLHLFSLPLLKLLLEPIEFRSMTCYCNWTDREPELAPHNRLILVLEK
jgi:SAM-dependent methyltransferase